METRNPKGWFITYTGRQFWPLEPRAEEVSIIDIAHALSHVARWTGHTREHFSVAQHSYLVSITAECSARAKDMAPGYVRTVALWGLLHDAPEAYIADVARPVKHDVFGQRYREIESRLMRAICDRFLLPHEMPAAVKEADDRLLVTERRDLMSAPPSAPVRDPDVAPLQAQIRPVSPPIAKAFFLERFAALTEGRIA